MKLVQKANGYSGQFFLVQFYKPIYIASLLLPSWRLHIDMNRFWLRVGFQALRTALASDAALFVSAEWGLRQGAESAVDTNGSGFDHACYSKGASDILRVYSGCEES